MFNILLIEQDGDFVDLLKKNIELELKCKLAGIFSLRELTKWLEQEKKIDLIICPQMLHQSTSPQMPAKIALQLSREHHSTHLFIYDSKDPKVSISHTCFDVEDYNISQIIENIKKHLDPDKKFRKQDVPQYVPFEIHYFFGISSFESDVFIKLKKKDGDQFVKRINANEEIDKSFLLKYKQSGMSELYIPKEFRFRFVDRLVENTLDRIKKINSSSTDNNVEKVVEIGDESFRLSAGLLQEFGITEQTIKITEASIVNIKRSMSQQDKIAPLLQKLLSLELSYAYKRCHLISMFSLEVLKRIDWFSRDQLNENFDRMTYAAFLHDIFLEDKKLLKVHSKMDLYKAELTDKEKDLITNHANLTSSLIQKYPKAPVHVDIIIKQHHGTTNGIGFSENINSGLAKLSILFIVVESFVIRLLDFKKGEESIKDIFEDLYDHYSLPSYRKVVDALKDTVIASMKSQKN